MIFEYGGGTRVSTEALNRACEAALKAIEKELPEEALTYEAYSAVLEECADQLKAKIVVL